MAESFIGEIRLFAGSFAPANWAFCQGQSVSISGNEALFQLIGTTYGGNGSTTFNLPDLRSRLPIHQGQDSSGNNYTMGQVGGAETVTIDNSTLATHSHPFNVNGNAGTGSPSASGANALFGPASNFTPYGTGSSPTPMSPKATSTIGGSQPHSNIKPYLCVNYIISLYGIYPSRS